MGRSFVFLPWLDACIATAVIFSTEKETNGIHQYKLYADKYRMIVVLGVEQLIGPLMICENSL